MRFPVVLLMACALGACSSERKRGDELFENGAYDEAAAAYERALQEDPKDADALVGLKKSRDQSIDRNLIQVRLARLGGNEGQALERLRTVVLQENQWKHFPGGKVAFTQEEETQYGFPYFLAEARNDLQARHPLQAEYWFKRFEPVFQGREYFSRLESLKNDMGRLGLEDCKRIQKQDIPLQAPYFAGWVSRYCAHWGVPVRDLSADDKKRAAELFAKVDLTGDVDKYPADQLRRIADSLQAGLEASPWYDRNGGKRAAIEIRGAYLEQHSEQQVQLYQNYTEKVPYTAYEPQIQYRQVPDKVIESGVDFKTGAATQVSVPTTRTESYQTQVPVTKYRDEQRAFPYLAVKKSQILEMKIHADADFGLDHASFDLSERSPSEALESDVFMPDIGLKPMHQNLQDAISWSSAVIQGLSPRLLESASRVWVSLYCTQGPSGGSPALTGNAVARCLRAKAPRGPEATPGFVRDWLSHEFGVSLEEYASLISLE